MKKYAIAAALLSFLAMPALAQTEPAVRFLIYGTTADLIVTYTPHVATSEGQGSGPSRVYRFPFYGEADVARCRAKGTTGTPEQDATIAWVTTGLLDLYPGDTGEFTLQCVGQVATPFDDPVSEPVQVGAP